MKQLTLLSIMRRSFLTELGERLKPFAYSPRQSQQDYKRKTSATIEFVHVSFIPHSVDVDLTVDVAVRFNAIEDIVNQFDRYSSPAEKKESATLGTELGNFRYGQPHRWTLYQPQDVAIIVASVFELIKEVGLPFIAQYSNLSNIRRALESNERDLRILCPFLGPRLMRAIAAQYLDQGWVDPALCDQYLSRLIEEDDLCIEDFRDLMNNLLSKPRPGNR